MTKDDEIEKSEEEKSYEEPITSEVEIQMPDEEAQSVEEKKHQSEKEDDIDSFFGWLIAQWK